MGEILKELTRLYGPSGREKQVAEFLSGRLPEKMERRVDAMGNLIVHVGGSGPRLVFSAHMDTVGMMVTRIDENGFCYFTNVGWLDPASVAQQTVVFENGVRAVVCIPDEKVGKELKLSDLYLDLGAENRAAAEKLTAVGEIAVFCPQYYETDSRIFSTFLDNRAGCAMLLEAILGLSSPKNDVYAVFSVQEEVGTRGIGPAAYGIDGAIGVAVDVTATDDVPGSSHDGTAYLGKGAAVKILDHSALCRPAVIEAMKEAAGRRRIAVQMDVMREGGTDAGPMAGVRGGMMTGGISLPCRYTHAPVEVCDRSDLAAATALIKALAETEIEIC